MKYPDSYVNLQLDEDIDVITCYKKDPTQPNWKIALPESMVVDTVKWFHQVMGHPGEKRSQHTLNQRYHHPKLRYHIDKLKCKDSQKYKRKSVKKKSQNDSASQWTSLMTVSTHQPH